MPVGRFTPHLPRFLVKTKRDGALPLSGSIPTRVQDPAASLPHLGCLPMVCPNLDGSEEYRPGISHTFPPST